MDCLLNWMEIMIELHHGDCLEIMKQIPDKSIDLVLTDPPYGMSYQSSWRTDKFEKIADDDNLNWLPVLFNEYNRVLKDDTAIYVFCSWHHIDKFKIEFEKFFDLKNILIWNKNNHGSGDLVYSYAPKHEFILYGNKGKCKLRNNIIADVISENKVFGGDMVHPTQKPVALLEKFILMSSDENSTIIDSYMGSGSTGVACVNTNRNFIGIELDENYFNIAKNRIFKEKDNRGIF